MLMRKTKKNTMTLIMMLASSEVVVQIGWRWCCRRLLWSDARRLLSPPTRPLTHSHPPTSQRHKYKHKYNCNCKNKHKFHRHKLGWNPLSVIVTNPIALTLNSHIQIQIQIQTQIHKLAQTKPLKIVMTESSLGQCSCFWGVFAKHGYFSPMCLIWSAYHQKLRLPIPSHWDPLGPSLWKSRAKISTKDDLGNAWKQLVFHGTSSF